MKVQYTKAKMAKVGDECKCPSCGSTFIKENYQQAFCKTKTGTICKDKYWNTITPNKRNNTIRISPRNQLWIDKKRLDREMYDDFDDDQSWDAHKSY